MMKAALQAFDKLAGVELAPHGLTINAISPEATLTERTLEEPGYQELWETLTPTGTVTRVEDIAHTALFLLSEKSHQITGQTIIVDGGRSEEHTSELQSRGHLVCRLLLEKKKRRKYVRQ